jgi:hypothetical protein
MRERFHDKPALEKLANISKKLNVAGVFVGLLIGGAFGAAFAFGNGVSAVLSDEAERRLGKINKKQKETKTPKSKTVYQKRVAAKASA